MNEKSRRKKTSRVNRSGCEHACGGDSLLLPDSNCVHSHFVKYYRNGGKSRKKSVVLSGCTAYIHTQAGNFILNGERTSNILFEKGNQSCRAMLGLYARPWCVSAVVLEENEEWKKKVAKNPLKKEKNQTGTMKTIRATLLCMFN